MLGITLAPYGKIDGSFPYEIGYSYGGNGQFMCPYDPYYNQRGEVGLYHDTQLGSAAPEYATLLASIAATIRDAMVKQGQTRGGMISRARKGGSTAGSGRRLAGLGSSIPSDMELEATYGYVPHMTGWITSSNQGFVQTSWIPPNGWRPSPLSGPSNQLRDIPPSNIDPEVAKVLAAMNAQNAKMFTLSVVTTLAIAVSAIIQVIRNTKALKQEHALLKRELATK